MNKKGIKKLIESFKDKRERTIVIVDFGNVEKWKHGLGWRVGVRELASLVKHFTYGKKFLRRFYYGADYGSDEKSTELTGWSKYILRTSETNGFHVVDKRVKYIHSVDNVHGFEKKCDLDVEMAVDLIKERDNYDNIVLFSGDGDLMCAVEYLKKQYNKNCIVFGSRDHTGREVFDARSDGVIDGVLFADDFEYRLNMDRFRKKR